MSLGDIGFIFGENYSAFLLLGGLFIIMFAYRDVHLPASRTFVVIAFALLAMCILFGLEHWAALSPARHDLRVATSILHYILQPFVIYLEIVVLLPPYFGKLRRFIVALPLLINAFIYLIAPLTGELVFRFDSDYSFHRGPLGGSIYIVTFIYLGFLLYLSARTFHKKDRRMSVILIFMAVIALVTGLLEGLNIITGYIDESFVLGVFLFYVYLVILHGRDMEEDLMRKELELSQTELSLLRHQIRPHFVFNALHIIKSLIRSNPDQAIRSLEDFSDYLRANLDIIRSEGLVSFEEELDNIEAYISLAHADESKGVNVVYDIQERDFRLPPLSVEPLIENAIMHGIAGNGTITLSTTSDEDAYIVKVADDGCGFDKGSTRQEKKRRGIGLDNVRTRLDKQCGGSLDIASDDNGTVVTIRIPKEQEAMS